MVEATSVVVSFGLNTEDKTETAIGTYHGESVTFNRVFSNNNAGLYTSDALKDINGNTTAWTISIPNQNSLCGAAGVFNPSSTDGFSDVFGADICTGNPNGGVANAGNTPLNLSLTNLSAGTYTLEMLVGRGNNYDGGAGTSSTFYLSGNNVSVTGANLLAYTEASAATVSGNSITVMTTPPDNNADDVAWALMQFEFEVIDDDSVLKINAENGVGNINAMAFTFTPIPEPATATLSLLGLSALMMRRRRD